MISAGLLLVLNLLVSLQLADGYSETCPENTYWDSDTEKCESSERFHKKSLQQSATCPGNLSWDSSSEQCQCDEDYSYDQETGMCIPQNIGCCNGSLP